MSRIDFKTKIISSFLLIFAVGFFYVKTASASTSSKIIFSDVNTQTFKSINPDGTGLTTLGTGLDPQISPDGTKIAFFAGTNNAFCQNGQRTDIFTMNADGTNIQNLTSGQPCDVYVHPSWSPDGTKIAFDKGQISRDIYVMNADGSNVTDLGVVGLSPSWSPDGTKIAFESVDNTSSIKIMNPDGSNVTTLTSGSVPAWSPDGTKIAYLSDNGTLDIINPDGSNHATVYTPQHVTALPIIESVPAWSPDSSMLAFTQLTQLTPTRTIDLYTIPISGGTPTLVYPGGLFDYVSWGKLQGQNQPPVIEPLSNTTINEGDIYSVNSSFTDPDSTSWTATVDFGDGSGPQPLTLSGTNFSLSHQFKDEGIYTVTVSVTDNQGATGTGTATVTVNNAPFSVGTMTVPTPVVQVNSSVSASASYTDPGVLDTHTASWNWGDGSSSTGTVTESNGSGTVSDSHTYTTTGVYTITLTVTDDDGLSSSSTYQYVSVYNPTSQGIFTAGQHFTSPTGAYAQNPSLTGTVRFGLSYKYQGTVPVGDKEFTMKFTAANLTFNATSVSSLVIANNLATLTGTGTINGGSHIYNFLVTGVNGGGIRIQITDPSNNNAVVYDTQPGAAAIATPTTSVTGQVIVHN